MRAAASLRLLSALSRFATSEPSLLLRSPVAACLIRRANSHWPRPSAARATEVGQGRALFLLCSSSSADKSRRRVSLGYYLFRGYLRRFPEYPGGQKKCATESSLRGWPSQ